MSLGQVWIVGLGLVFSLGLVITAFYFLRYYRKRLLPPIERRDRGEVLTQLHILQAEMRKELEEESEPEGTPEVEDSPPPPAPEPLKKPQDEESRKEALAQLQALQAKMRKRLEEDQAREAAEGADFGSSDAEIQKPDPEI